MLRNIFPLIFSLCVATSLAAQPIYLKMDVSCMDRFEYNSSNSTNPYVSYSFKIGSMQFASFDVGLESSNWVKDLPGKVTYCNTLKIDKDFVNKVNDGTTRLYIVRETPSSYHIADVDKASLLETKGGNMEFSTADGAFSLNLNSPLSGVNLALPGSKTAFYLDGIINYQCLKGYILQKKESSDSRSFKEYVIIPDIGIVERASVAKTGFVNDLLRDNEFKLTKVDEVPFSSVVSIVCDHVQSIFYDGVAGTNPTQTGGNDVVTSKGGSDTPTGYGNTDPCAPTTEPGVHIVQKGETLYSLSKRYGVQVDQLQNWNNLANSNIISICQRLWVKLPNSTSTTNTGTQTTEKAGSTTTASSGYWTKSEGDHQVRYGESVASLAKMYGFTEERFRKMNGLSATENVLPGQRLRTNDCNCPTLETSTSGTPLPYDKETDVVTNKDGTADSKVVNNQDVYYRPISVHVVKGSDT
ncbi:MAG: LysM peptidoglycan-binding domain-containing protein, partial [Saprospiraceae bacterium]|nr:LysM peptidoglycan-binding domain-containing protein [Saprospiraceae bacterium]